MAKNFQFTFGVPASSFAGLSPTLSVFVNTSTGLTAAPPGITEIFSGVYEFLYEPGQSFSIYFEADGGVGLGSNRYVPGTLDPIIMVDQKVGFGTDSFGSTAIDPGTMYGMIKRLQELLEGNAVFNKSTGVWDVYSRGSSTLLREKTLTNTTSSATKT